MQFRRCSGIAAAALAALLLAGCSGGGISMPSVSLSSVFNSGPKPAGDPSAPALPPNLECPSIAIRQGASTLSVSANPTEPTATNLRYQIGFGTTARECRLAPGNMISMKVGVEGRIILGPAGTAGQFEVPLRVAVVQEGVTPKTIVTRLQRVPVTVPADTTSALFTHIEEDLAFPMPKGNEIDSYVVYIGFDPAGAREMDRKKPPTRPSRPPPRAGASSGASAPL
jgi:hypothetical protein